MIYLNILGIALWVVMSFVFAAQHNWDAFIPSVTLAFVLIADLFD